MKNEKRNNVSIFCILFSDFFGAEVGVLVSEASENFYGASKVKTT
ncbi:hypothetical protein [Petrotoga mobilis]|uniref:Uncharacterized protein n=1 Tax=Petrotoga olearia DSM 13574 TaxID=1122955 RepID=A0A2K1NZ63_9BACT|nr:hypothetical protein [Petrotoga mobilis]PNR95829.1 hypothetical protein X929_07015 [Petrotoga olearia DSM 13574]